MSETIQKIQKSNLCGGGEKTQESCGGAPALCPVTTKPEKETPDCGAAPVPESGSMERPGYKLLHFVEGFAETPAGPVPKVKTVLERTDFLGAIKMRLDIGRNRYEIAPGLYCVGNPGEDSPVLVTANYKLSFDTLRKELEGVDAWILVLDTRGINVWCAAGKRTFSTEELILRVKLTGLEKVVKHGKLILPQLSATGVSAHLVKKGCGFSVIWGPIRAKDIKTFLEKGMKVDKSMRMVTFSFLERLVLVPVEILIVAKSPNLWILLAVFLLSGIGLDIFSFSAMWSRGLMATAAYAAGILAGGAAVPMLLPWIPGKAFYLKGAITGLIAGAAVAISFWGQAGGLEFLSLLLFATAVSAFLAMNFTGATPFTSPSGVEKEMRKAIPLQAAALFVAVITWVGSAFIG
jgi:hypothetical protein